ncbi:MAG: DUF4394 domain-containing protein, partial [Bacteroidota bacterium]
MRKLILPVLCTILGLSANRTEAQTVYALNTAGNQISVFNAATPGTIARTLNVTGTTALSSIVGMDFRPATGQLYILGYLNVAVKTGQLYTVDTLSGFATPVGSPILNFPIDGHV